MTNKATKAQTVAGWIIGIIPCLLLLFSSVMKFVRPPGFSEGMEHIGWTESKATGLGIIELVCTLVYLVPRTSALGAILLTGYMGGAIATHLRVGDPYFVQPVIGIMLWMGLYLREPRLRFLLPLRQPPQGEIAETVERKR